VIISLNIIKTLNYVMVTCGVLFEVRTEFVNVIKTSFSFEGLKLQNFIESGLNLVTALIASLSDYCIA
jgi:hypothetical protein